MREIALAVCAMSFVRRRREPSELSIVGRNTVVLVRMRMWVRSSSRARVAVAVGLKSSLKGERPHPRSPTPLTMDGFGLSSLFLQLRAVDPQDPAGGRGWEIKGGGAVSALDIGDAGREAAAQEACTQHPKTSSGSLCSHPSMVNLLAKSLDEAILVPKHLD